MKMKSTCFLLFCSTVATPILCNSKKYVPDESGFEPSNRYYESNLPDYRHKITRNETKPDRKDSKESRFGIIPITTGYGTSGNGNGVQYGTSGVMISPMKIDLGGVALGALLGLGAILIVPKLAHVLSGGLGGYRSLENELSSVGDILARIDNSLEQQNIDSSTCIQRIICSYVNDAGKNINNGEASIADEFIFSLTKCVYKSSNIGKALVSPRLHLSHGHYSNTHTGNTVFSRMADGTAIKQAVEMGKTGNMENCSPFNARCPITRENVVKIISSLLPA